MSDEEMMQIDDDDVMPIKSKGKGKAVENGESDDNLPWYASKRGGQADDLQGREISTKVS